MALKPTIYKVNIDLSHVDEDYYDQLNLTVALHPSENPERMMVRILAFCLNARENLTFTRGLCVVEEPDIWEKTLDDQIALWIDVGEPAFERLKKASRTAGQVKVYSFNSKSTAWWDREGEAITGVGAQCFRFPWPEVQALAQWVSRTMDLAVTISDNTLYISGDPGACEVSLIPLN